MPPGLASHPYVICGPVICHCLLAAALCPTWWGHSYTHKGPMEQAAHISWRANRALNEVSHTPQIGSLHCCSSSSHSHSSPYLGPSLKQHPMMRCSWGAALFQFVNCTAFVLMWEAVGLFSSTSGDGGLCATHCFPDSNHSLVIFCGILLILITCLRTLSSILIYF